VKLLLDEMVSAVLAEKLRVRDRDVGAVAARRDLPRPNSDTAPTVTALVTRKTTAERIAIARPGIPSFRSANAPSPEREAGGQLRDQRQHDPACLRVTQLPRDGSQAGNRRKQGDDDGSENQQ
jgi:hypothetical protein